MGKYNAYEKYKDSGVEWLGEIPEHWEVKRFKFLLSEPFKYGANEAAEIDDPSLPRYIRITDVKDDGTLREDTFRSLPENIAKDYLLEEGDILLTRSGATVGKSFIYRQFWGKAAYAGYLIRARLFNQTNSNFVYKFLQSSSYWDWVNSIFIQATIQNISAEKYANLSISIPPLPEQQAIANFLDYKTKQIDALINKKETLLEKLDEKRTAIISHAVTKGLDPNISMKDSGVEWLGDIPEHWIICRVKNLAKTITKGTTPSTEGQTFTNSGIRYIKAENIVNNNILLEPEFFISEETDKLLKRSRLKANDILFVIAGATIGKTAIVSEDFIPGNTNQAVSLIRPNNKVLPEFLHLWLQSDYTENILKTFSVQSAQPNISMEKLGEILVYLPPLNEQIKIKQFLDHKTKQIDQQKAKIQQAIDRLKEYRTALITNAVTGKIDVRQVSIP